MKRASYREAVAWIALNDNAGEDTPKDVDSEQNVAGYITTCLIADIFGVTEVRVARDVMRQRRKGAA